MSLTNRLSLFFLAAIALVLLGFSLTIYFVARVYLNTQLDNRLHSAMQTLVGCVEIHPADVQWEPLERRITLGEDPALDQPRWTLHDLKGRLLDRSMNIDQIEFGTQSKNAGHWRVLIRRIQAGNFDAEAIDGKHDPRKEIHFKDFVRGEIPERLHFPRIERIKEMA